MTLLQIQHEKDIIQDFLDLLNAQKQLLDNEKVPLMGATTAAIVAYNALKNKALSSSERTERITELEGCVSKLKDCLSNKSESPTSYQEVLTFDDKRAITASSYGSVGIVNISEDRNIFQIVGNIDDKSLQNLSREHTKQSSFDQKFGSGHRLGAGPKLN